MRWHSVDSAVVIGNLYHEVPEHIPVLQMQSMQPLARRPDLLHTASHAASPGVITTLTNAHGVTIHGQSAADGQTLLALYVYKADETYDVVYTLLDGTGQVADILHEQEGILPAFFQSPGQVPWVSVRRLKMAMP